MQKNKSFLLLIIVILFFLIFLTIFINFILNINFDNYQISLSIFLRKMITSDSWILAGISSLIAGFLTSLSPCVYPIIPITLGVIGIKRYNSKFNGFCISGTYVLGMVVLYVFLGILFTSFGILIGSILQNSYITGMIALLFFLISFNVFGFFDLMLPQSLSKKISNIGDSSYKGAFLMGLIAGLIAAPCTGPVLIFILTLVSIDGNFLTAIYLMILYALGMGIPFLFLGTFSSIISYIPKSGQWMNIVKDIFGLSIFGGAIYYLGCAFNHFAQVIGSFSKNILGLSIAILIVGIILIEINISYKYLNFINVVKKKLGLLICFFAITLIVANLNFSIPYILYDKKNNWRVLSYNDESLKILNKILIKAKNNNQPVMLSFYADWCISCKKNEQITYLNKQILLELKRFVLIKIDATKKNIKLIEIHKQYNVIGLPTIIFMNSKGELLSKYKLNGFIEPSVFLKIIKQIK